MSALQLADSGLERAGILLLAMPMLGLVARVGRVANATRYWGETIDYIVARSRPLGVARVATARIWVWAAGTFLAFVISAFATFFARSLAESMIGWADFALGRFRVGLLAAFWAASGALLCGWWLLELRCYHDNRARALAEIAAWRKVQFAPRESAGTR